MSHVYIITNIGRQCQRLFDRIDYLSLRKSALVSQLKINDHSIAKNEKQFGSPMATLTCVCVCVLCDLNLDLSMLIVLFS